MDKNQLTGLLAMLVLLLVYFQFFAPDPAEYSETESLNATDSTSYTVNPQPGEEVTSATLDSSQQAQRVVAFGSLGQNTLGEEREITLESDQLKVWFSNKGGTPKRVELKAYKDYLGNPLALLVEEKSQINIYFELEGKTLQFSDLFFDSQVRNFSDSTEILFTLAGANGPVLTQVYTLYNDRFEMGYRIISSGFDNLAAPRDLVYSWLHKANRIEPDLKDPRTRTTVRYRTGEGDVDYISATATGHEEKTLNEPVQWVAFKQKYFTAAIFSEKGFSQSLVTSDLNEADTSSVKYLTMTNEIPITQLNDGPLEFKYYFGPNSYYPLEAFAPDFTENLNLGWSILAVVNKYLILPIWRVLESAIPSYPVVIIILVIIIRLLLSPLTYKSHISMAKMRVLKPELDQIKEKHGDDMQKTQQEQMALYQKVGINPLSGCIPMLLQFPILVALFYYIPNAIELRQVSFLWAHDLSTYDSIWDFGFEIPFYGDHISLFTLLMTVSTLLYTWSNSQMTTVQGPMKSLQYVMPIMLLFFFNSYSSGLTYYYFISNLVSFGQIYLFRAVINEDKIKAILEENRKKNANKKKSKFQTRLEEAMKANEEARKKSKKKR